MGKNRSRIIKVAVVGGGSFGEVHLRTFRGIPQVEIGGVYTLDSSRGELLCQRYGGKNYPNLTALAEDPSLDLVTIATPESEHLQPFQILAQNKRAIYLEKPIATTLAEAATILRLSKSIRAMSGHCLRFEARVANVFERLQGKKKFHLSFRDRRTRTEKNIYGRVHPACAMLCHETELSNAFAESPFRRVIALNTQFSSGQIDGITILIEYKNGTTSSIDGGWYLPSQTGCADNDFISVVSEAGVDEITLPSMGFFSVRQDGIAFPNLHYGHSIAGTEYGPLRVAFDYMIKCIRDDVDPSISTIADGYEAVAVVAAAIRSTELNRWVERNELELP